MPEPTGPTKPTETAATNQAASVRRVVAEAARNPRTRPGGWVPVTLARAALAEAAGLLPRHSIPDACRPPTPPTRPDRLPEDPPMITITTPNPPTELRAAEREQAAIARLATAVASMRTWRQLAAVPASATHPTAAGRAEPAHHQPHAGSAA